VPAGLAHFEGHVQEKGEIRAGVTHGEIDDAADGREVELATVSLISRVES
jgi:hypothetical protein